MKLIVTDKGDPSVGIESRRYEVECPLIESDDKDAFRDFKDSIKNGYELSAVGKLELLYDFEIEAIGKSFADYGLNNG